MQQDSIFTKIIKGDIPSVKVYEDELTLAFMDIQPIQPGQVVVVPKSQVANIWDLSPADYQALMATVQKVGAKMRNVFTDKQYVGVNIEGLGVKDHAHVKVFPFNNGEEYHNDPNSNPVQTADQLEVYAQKLRLNA